jgi:polysaccharide biosynthesis protein PelC
MLGSARTWLTNRIRLVTWLGFVVTLSACVGGQQSVDFVGGAPAVEQLRIAVMPLENLTNFPRAGVIVSELLATELYQQKIFELVENSEVRRTMSGLTDSADAPDLAIAPARIAEALAVQAVLTGTVSEYGYQHGLHEEPVVGINLRLIRTSDQTVIWAASHSTTGSGYFSRDSVNAAAQRVIKTMVSTLVSKSRPLPN